MKSFSKKARNIRFDGMIKKARETDANNVACIDLDLSATSLMLMIQSLNIEKTWAQLLSI